MPKSVFRWRRHEASRFQRSIVVAAALSGAALALAACGAGLSARTSSDTGSPRSLSAATAYPVSVSNCGSTVTVGRAPSRAVSNDVNTTEDLLALGLASRMVGDFGVDPSAAAGIPAAYQAGYRAVRNVSPHYFTLEPLVGLKPDFLFAGYNYGLQAGSPTLTPAGLSNYGITTLALTESCAHVTGGGQAASIDAEYQDLTNLGAIFDVNPRAAALVASMKAQVAAVHAKVDGIPKVSVFLYDSGQSAPFTAPALAMPDALIDLAGGANVFAGLMQTWTSVSWEQVVAANPACILINDYDTPSWQQKERFLTTFALTKNLTAVQNHCFLHLRYDQLTPSPQNAAAVTAIARWLHPEAFGIRTAASPSR